jgi:hypothetical protein
LTNTHTVTPFATPSGTSLRVVDTATNAIVMESSDSADVWRHWPAERVCTAKITAAAAGNAVGSGCDIGVDLEPDKSGPSSAGFMHVSGLDLDANELEVMFPAGMNFGWRKLEPGAYLAGNWPETGGLYSTVVMLRDSRRVVVVTLLPHAIKYDHLVRCEVRNNPTAARCAQVLFEPVQVGASGLEPVLTTKPLKYRMQVRWCPRREAMYAGGPGP